MLCHMIALPFSLTPFSFSESQVGCVAPPFTAPAQCSAEMKSLALCLLALLPLTLAEPLHFVDCGSPDGKTVVVDISPCPTQPCPLKKGEDYLVNITFSSAVDTQKSRAIVHGIIKMIPIPFTIPEADGCKSGIECPIQHGQSYNYVAKLPIKTSYPCIELAVKWELTDDDDKDLFCWKIPVVIVN